MSPKTKLLLAKIVAAVLGVAILLVVGLMIYLSIAKVRSDQSAPKSEESGSVKTNFQLIEGQALIPAGCEVAETLMTSNRIVLRLDGPEPDCAALLILKSSDGSLIAKVALKG